jgi:hypothetical protein
LHIAGKEELIMAKNQKEHIKELEEKVKALEHKDEYQGWANRETWAMGLWIDNDQGLYNEAREKVQAIIKNIDNDENVKNKIWKRDQAIVFRTEDALKNWMEELKSEAYDNPADHVELLKMWDDIGSDYRIDWRELAEAYVRNELESMEHEKKQEKKNKEELAKLHSGEKYVDYSWQLEPGYKVRLRDDVLQRHARSVPAHLGYTPLQFTWREKLKQLEGKTGTVHEITKESNFVQVDFDGLVIEIQATELILIKK